MKTFPKSQLSCPHGSLLVCQDCVRQVNRERLNDPIVLFDTAECDWPDRSVTREHLKLASESLKPKRLTLRAGAGSDESEIERRLLG